MIPMLLYNLANDRQRIGTLIDLVSDTNNITHKAANELNLRSEYVTLVVHSFKVMKVSVPSKHCILKIRVST